MKWIVLLFLVVLGDSVTSGSATDHTTAFVIPNNSIVSGSCKRNERQNRIAQESCHTIAISPKRRTRALASSLAGGNDEGVGSRTTTTTATTNTDNLALLVKQVRQKESRLAEKTKLVEEAEQELSKEEARLVAEEQRLADETRSAEVAKIAAVAKLAEKEVRLLAEEEEARLSLLVDEPEEPRQQSVGEKNTNSEDDVTNNNNNSNADHQEAAVAAKEKQLLLEKTKFALQGKRLAALSKQVEDALALVEKQQRILDEKGKGRWWELETEEKRLTAMTKQLELARARLDTQKQQPPQVSKPLSRLETLRKEVDEAEARLRAERLKLQQKEEGQYHHGQQEQRWWDQASSSGHWYSARSDDWDTDVEVPPELAGFAGQVREAKARLYAERQKQELLEKEYRQREHDNGQWWDQHNGHFSDGVAVGGKFYPLM